MQNSELPKPESSYSESYEPSEFSEFLQENWIYLVILVVIIYIVIMYTKILKDRKKNKEE